MKKLLLVLFIIAQSLTLTAQTVITTFKNELVKKENGEWVTKDINYESLTIKVYDGLVIVDDKAHSVYRTFGETRKNHEKNGIFTYYSALDETSTACTIALFKPYDTDEATPFIGVMYKYSWYVYYFTQIY